MKFISGSTRLGLQGFEYIIYNIENYHVIEGSRINLNYALALSFLKAQILIPKALHVSID